MSSVVEEEEMELEAGEVVSVRGIPSFTVVVAAAPPWESVADIEKRVTWVS